ncbi:MAG TPA: hypothetical protein PLB02_11790 [Thermoanaerobaculia bacterium]|nr:hypothetical protein [Thermoanaerobaculia bacterium]
MLVAYPLISLDQIGIELQNPFSKQNLSHLPLGDISATIERNLAGILKAGTSAPASLRPFSKSRAATPSGRSKSPPGRGCR